LCLGTIAEHPFLVRQQRLTFARAGRTRPLELDDYAASEGWAGLDRARTLPPEQVIAEVAQSGLRGRGGAGFPAGIKWRTVAEARGSRQ
jgi:formate dehydrogenase iron-sulfur subunit